MPRRSFSFVRMAVAAAAGLGLLWQPLAVAADLSALNLGSTQHTVQAGQLSGFTPAHIDVAGHSMSVSAGTMLTPGEATALLQVISAGHQSIVLSAGGSAVGGSFNLSQSLANQFSSITVPRDVRAIDSFSAGNSLVINGDLSNFGALYAVSTNSAIHSVTLAAQNISNYAGATISSVVPAAGLSGVNSAVPNLDLTLAAANSILNKGTMSSSGSLTLNAGGTITANGGSMTAVDAINMTTQGGDINLRGGNYQSQSLNINAGAGSFDGNVGLLTGTVNVDACNARLFTGTPVLNVGQWNVSGDPVIANTNAIVLSTVGASGAPLVVVSGADITASTGATIDTSSSSGNGGNVYLLAGVQFKPNPYPQTANPAPAITISGPSKTGGHVDLTNLTTFNTGSTSGGNANGGNVEIGAFAGSATGSGTINVPTTITTVGTGNGSPGHVFLIAGASTKSASSPSINIDDINTNGGTSTGSTGLAGGHVVIATEQPNISSKNPMVIDPNTGAVLQGGLLGGAIAQSPVNIGQITTGGGQVYVFSGMGISASGNITTSSSTNGVPSGMVTMIGNASGKSAATSDIAITGSIQTKGTFTSGGNVFLMTGSDVSVASVDTSSNASTGGGVYVFAGGTTGKGNINISGINSAGARAGGNIVEVTASGNVTNTSLDTNGVGTSTGSGGSITISAPGTVTLTNNVNASGGSSGTAGSVFLAAGANSGLTVTGSISATGQTNGGVYCLTTGSTPPSVTINNGTGNVEQLAYTPTTTAIGPNTTTSFTVDSPASGSFSQFAPGGYTSINDQGTKAKGGAFVDITVNTDSRVIIPIVSTSTTTPLTLIGTSSNPSGIKLDTSNNSNGASLLLFSPAGINVGSANAFIAAVNGSSSPILAAVAANNGSVTVNNASPYGSALGVGIAASSSGTLSISAPGLTIGGAISASTPAKGASIVLDSPGLSSLALAGIITSAAGVALNPTGIGNIDEANATVIGGSFLQIGNANMAGLAGAGAFPILADVNSIALTTSRSISNSGGSVLAVEDASLTFNVGGTVTIQGGSALTVLPSTAGGVASIQAGSIQAASSATTAIKSPFTFLLPTTGDIGSSSQPFTVGALQGASSAATISVTAPGNAFLKNTDKQGIILNGTAASTLSMTASGSISLEGTVSAPTMSLTTGPSGGLLSIFTSTLGSGATATLTIKAGSLGVGLPGPSSGGQIQLGAAGTDLQVNTTGGVRLLAANDVVFDGASSAGKSSTGLFLFSQSGNILFSSNGAITAPSVFLQASGTGAAIDQASSTLPSINATTVVLVADGTIGGTNPILLSGGTVTAQSANGNVNLNSTKSLSLAGSSSAGANMSIGATGNINFNSGSTLSTTQQLDLTASGSIIEKSAAPSGTLAGVTLLLDANGAIGTSALPVTINMAPIGTYHVLLSLTTTTGGAFATVEPDPANGNSREVDLFGSSVGKNMVVSGTAPMGIECFGGTAVQAGTSATITSGGALFQVDSGLGIRSPVISLTGANTTSTPITVDGISGAPALTLNFPGTASQVNISAQNSLVLAGSSSVSGASLSVQAGGNINFAKDATLSDVGQLVVLQSTGLGSITQSAKGTDVIAQTLNIGGGSAGTSAISIGVSSNTSAPITVFVDGLKSNAYIAASGPVTVTGNSPFIMGGTLQVTAGGASGLSSILVTQSISAQTITLQTTNNSNIQIGTGSQSVFLNAAGTETISASGTGNIVTVSAGPLSLLEANSLVLTTGSGSIFGVGSAGAVATDAAMISANVQSGKTGSVSIENNLPSPGMTTLMNSSAGAGFSFICNGMVVVHNVTTRGLLSLNNGTITIFNNDNTSGTISIAPGAKIAATGGGVNIVTVNGNTGTAPNIDFGKGAQVTTLATPGNGAVQILAGTSSAMFPATGQTAPTGLKIIANGTGGSYSLGATGSGLALTVAGTGNVLHVNGDNIFFNTGASNIPQLIKLEGGVIITADPIAPVSDVESSYDREIIVDSGAGF